jgi:hypothetical protein
MFDINSINRRYFEIKLNDTALEVEAPKVKTLKKIMSLSKVRNEDAMDELAEAVRTLLSKNRSGYKVADELVDGLDLDQLNGILTAYFEWLTGNKNSPN